MAPCCSLIIMSNTAHVRLIESPQNFNHLVKPFGLFVLKNLAFRENKESCIYFSLIIWSGFYWLSWGYASMGHHHVRAFIIDQENVVCGVSMVLQQFEVGQLKGDAMEMLKPSRLHVPIWLLII